MLEEIKVNIIPCSEDCIHQDDGYCAYDHTTVAMHVGIKKSECIYYNPRNKKNDSSHPLYEQK